MPEARAFLSFEPWCGGFNNVRMSLEIAYALAYMDARTLVLPPRYRIPFHDRLTLLTDFFEISGLPTMSFEDFRSSWKSRSPLPTPSRRPEWRRRTSALMTELWNGIERIAAIPDHNPLRTVFCFPHVPRHSVDFDRFLAGREAVDGLGVPGRPVIVHFPQTLLGPFYTMIYTADPKPLRRAVRDGVRYQQWLWDAAKEVVRALGPFSSLHVRRGDFSVQFPKEVLSERQLAESVRALFHPGERLFIATDEIDRRYFQPLTEHYELKFIDDFLPMLPVNAGEREYSPLIEQIVCAHGRIFVGTKFSTMSSYIYRLRGYLGQADTQYYSTSSAYRDPEDVAEPSWFGLVPSGNHWTREFPEAWQCHDEQDQTRIHASGSAAARLPIIPA